MTSLDQTRQEMHSVCLYTRLLCDGYVGIIPSCLYPLHQRHCPTPFILLQALSDWSLSR